MRTNINLKTPILQVALDQTDLDEALDIAKDAVRGGVDWIEAGTPLIKSVGMSAIRNAKRESPDKIIVAEMKPMDAGRLELELAFEAGADVAIITGLAPPSTIEECIHTGRSFDKKVILDTDGMQQLLGKKKAQAVLMDIRQRYRNTLTTLPKDSSIVTSLDIKREGVHAVKRLKQLSPAKCVVADLKAISDVDKELELAFEAGADVACVAAAAGLNEIRKAVAVARELDCRVMVDLIAMRDHLGEDMAISLAKEIEDTGADYICYHVPIDDQVRGRHLPPESVRKIAAELSVPVATAGGINVHSAPYLLKAGSKIIIVGGAITKAKKPSAAAERIKKAMVGSSKLKDESLKMKAQSSRFPILQFALDVADLDEAITIAKKAGQYVDWLEVGSILSTGSGTEPVKRLRKIFPEKIIVDDLKVVDFGAIEVELAARAGADIIGLWGAARNSTIRMAIKRAKELGLKVMIDTGQDEPLEKVKVRAKELEAMGADYVVYLIPKDEQALDKRISPPTVSALNKVLDIPLAVAGGLDAQSGPRAVEAGARVLIIGEAIYKAKDPGEAAKQIREEIRRVKPVSLPIRQSASEIIKETLDILMRHIRHVAHSLNKKRTEQFLRVLKSANRVIITGVGRSRIVGRFTKNWLNKLGMDVRVIEMGDEDVPSDFSHKLGDILIPISASGKTPSIVDYSSTLRQKGKGIIMVLPITAKPHGPAWQKTDLTLTVNGRTKEDWRKEREKKVGQRVPLGTLCEFATLVFLLAATQAIIEEEPTILRVKAVMLKMAEELKGAVRHIEGQRDSFEHVVEAILDSKWKGSRVVLDGFGRLERINCMFASRLIQVYGLNPMILREDITAKIRDLDTVIISSLSGEIEQTFKTVNHCTRERRITPIYFTGLGDSPVHQLISTGKVMDKRKTVAEGKVLGIFVPGTVARRGKIVSFSERQFVEEKKRITPLDDTAEVVLLAIFEGIFACIMERLGLTEENLEHADLE